MTTDTSEKGLEELIVRSMTGRTDVLVPAHEATETSVPVARAAPRAQLKTASATWSRYGRFGARNSTRQEADSGMMLVAAPPSVMMA